MEARVGVNVRCGRVTVNGTGFRPKDPLGGMAPWTIGLVLDVLLVDELLDVNHSRDPMPIHLFQICCNMTQDKRHEAYGEDTQAGAPGKTIGVVPDATGLPEQPPALSTALPKPTSWAKWGLLGAILIVITVIVLVTVAVVLPQDPGPPSPPDTALKARLRGRSAAAPTRKQLITGVADWTGRHPKAVAVGPVLAVPQAERRTVEWEAGVVVTGLAEALAAGLRAQILGAAVPTALQRLGVSAITNASVVSAAVGDRQFGCISDVGADGPAGRVAAWCCAQDRLLCRATEPDNCTAAPGEVWPPEQAQWCCQTRGLHCDGEASPASPLPSAPSASQLIASPPPGTPSASPPPGTPSASPPPGTPSASPPPGTPSASPPPGTPSASPPPGTPSASPPPGTPSASQLIASPAPGTPPASPPPGTPSASPPPGTPSASPPPGTPSASPPPGTPSASPPPGTPSASQLIASPAPGTPPASPPPGTPSASPPPGTPSASPPPGTPSASPPPPPPGTSSASPPPGTPSASPLPGTPSDPLRPSASLPPSTPSAAPHPTPSAGPSPSPTAPYDCDSDSAQWPPAHAARCCAATGAGCPAPGAPETNASVPGEARATPPLLPLMLSTIVAPPVLRDRQTLTVLFSRAVIPLGSNFAPAEDPDALRVQGVDPLLWQCGGRDRTAAPPVPGRARWVTTSILRFDPSADWATDLRCTLFVNPDLRAFDGTLLAPTDVKVPVPVAASVSS